MSFSMQRLRSLLPGQHGSSSAAKNAAQRHSVSLEPEIGFQICIETTTQQLTTNGSDAVAGSAGSVYTKTAIPELNVQLIAARHLPALFGFKVVQGYLVKVKLFPGSKRLDSSIQTNSWPKFNETFKFPLAPDIKPSLKHSARRSSRTASEFTPEELFAGQFVVFTVYALLELPPASFNRFNKTYRSLRDKSSNLVQKVVESSNGKSKDDKENSAEHNPTESTQKVKRKPSNSNPRDAMPQLTISESRRNIGSVTCYLEPKIFKRNSRNGLYCTEELWLPIKDITTTAATKGQNNNQTNAPKGVVELALEIRDLSENIEVEMQDEVNSKANAKTTSSNGRIGTAAATPPSTPVDTPKKPPQWNRMTSEMKRKMGIGSKTQPHDFVLRVTTARMRCTNKVKDELESTAGSVYVKTTIFEHGILLDSWKSSNFYPSLSTKWGVGDAATVDVPLHSLNSLEHILVRTTLATKTKMGKKLVLGTVLVGATTNGSGAEHMQLLRETPLSERAAMWHCYQ